jgi:integrase
MPQRCVDALRALWDDRTCTHALRAECDCLVFTSRVGTPLDAHNVRSDFRKVAEAAGLMAGEWTARELRHSFVSLLSDDGMPIEHIARLVGHTSTAAFPHRMNLDAMKEREAPLLHRIKNLAGSSCVASGSLSGRPVALSSSGELL